MASDTKTTLCVECRATFSDADIADATCCPHCKTVGVPADLSLAHTITLTDHEWRILFMWSDNYSRSIDSRQAESVMAALRNEARRQCSDMPNLSLFEDIQDVATQTGRTVEMVSARGDKRIIEPQTPQTRH